MNLNNANLRGVNFTEAKPTSAKLIFKDALGRKKIGVLNVSRPSHWVAT